MMFKSQIEGLSETLAMMREMPKATGKNVLRRAGREELKPLAAAMRQKVRRVSGQLGDSIAVSTKLSRNQRRRRRRENPGDIDVYAGPGALPQAHLQEFEPGGTPFVRPVWDEHKGQLAQRVARRLWIEVNRAASRRRKKLAKRGK